MRSMMLGILFLTGCACCKKHDMPVCPPNGTIIYPSPPKIVETLPPPPAENLPPAGPPTPFQPASRVKVTEITPLHVFPPLPIDPAPTPLPVEVPQWEEPKIIFPKEGNPVIRAKVQNKITVSENPPYNGMPNFNYEVFWTW